MAETSVRVRAILELLGKPKEHVEEIARALIKKLKESNEFTVHNEFFSDTEQKEHLFSLFVEIEFEAKKFEDLFGFCFDYMPSSIEIISPEEFKLNAAELTGYLSDLQAKLHNTEMVTKKLNSVVLHLRANVYSLVKNIVLLLLRNNELDLATISKHSGIGETELNQFLERLIKEGTIKKEGEKFSIVK
ncbi:hypothetical protein KY330_01035 [Candidatus Woesearchaeota archaeon]|nr:hypothetical protein [Candidatus Woesearchaeota archaeon]